MSSAPPRGNVLLAAIAVALLATAAWGKTFETFEAKDAVTGERFSLEDLRGKVVLIDFWASWCRPCVGEIPNVRRVYDEYKDKGFEIVSISLDSDRSRFRSAIKRNRMRWRHVMEGGGWNTRLAKQYGVHSIPKMYLLDHRGVIISESARGPELQRLVAAAIKNLPEGAKPAPPDGGIATKGGSSAGFERLREEVTGARNRLDRLSEPLDELDTTLDNAGDAIESLERRLLQSDSGDAERRRYQQLREDLTAARCRLFVCGALTDHVPLPGAVFGAEPPPRADFARAMGQLPIAKAAVATFHEKLDRLRDELAGMDDQLLDLAKQADRGDARTPTAQGTKMLRQAEELVVRCRTAWQRQLAAATATVEALASSGDDGSRLDAIETRIAECRDQLQALALGEIGAATVHDTLAAICGEIAAIAPQGAGSDSAIKLPTNPLKRGSGSDYRARIEAAVQLDVAAAALKQIRESGAGPDDARVEELRTELAALATAADGTNDEKRLNELEARFAVLACRVLELQDQPETPDANAG